jgi:amino acid permease
MAYLADLATSWGSIYANHAALRTAVVFAHVASLIVGGGAAIAADRATLGAIALDDEGRDASLQLLHGTHRLVIVSLTLVAVSGLTMFAADVTTFVYSRVFWIKMGLVALLVVNGALLWRSEKRAGRRDSSAWRTLRVTALASVALWLLATLAGVALTNIG